MGPACRAGLKLFLYSTTVDVPIFSEYAMKSSDHTSKLHYNYAIGFILRYVIENYSVN